MANYDQSGKPIGGQQQTGAQQGAGRPSGGTQQAGSHGASGQQSQYSPAREQEQRNRMQQGSRGSVANYRGGLFPDLHEGFGGNPFQLISRLSDEMDHIFESFGMGGLTPRFGRGATSERGGQDTTRYAGQGLRELWAPRIEMCEREGKLLIQADLPGVRKEDVDVQIEDDAVVIQGQRHQENTRDEQGFYHSERSYGSFYRVIPLPEGTDAEQANATFRDGVLQVEVPLPQQRQRGRRLEIRDAGSSQGHLGSHAGTTQGSGSGTQAPLTHATQGTGGGAAGQPSQGQWSAGAQHTQGEAGSAQQGSSQSPAGQQRAEGSAERR